MTTFDFLQQAVNSIGVIAEINTGAGTGDQPWYVPFVFPAFLLAVLYFAVFRPQANQRKEQEKLIQESKIGDKIETSGGIVGIITNVRDKTFIIKTADQTKLELMKAHVVRVLQEGKEKDSKDVKEAAPTISKI